MTAVQHFDCIVIGTGPAGTCAAFAAAKAGMQTAVIESGFPGGTCLNAGCVPTKFLIGSTQVLPMLEAQRKYKVVSGEVEGHLAALQDRKERFIKGSRNSLLKRFSDAGIAFFPGKASFINASSLSVAGAEEKCRLEFKKAIIATGSTPATFPGLKPDGQTVLSAASLLNLKEPPESMIIIGGGAIGIELGGFYHRLGTKITLVEGTSRILHVEDAEVSTFLQKHLIRNGWNIYTGKRIASVTTEEGHSKLILESGEELIASRSLIAIGRRANIFGLELDAAGIQLTQRGCIDTDIYLRCSENIYAIGDVNGRTLLSHAADHQGNFAARHACGKERAAYAPPAMPSCVYGTMETMRVGPTTEELLALGKPFSVSRALLAENVIQQSSGHPQGFVKMLWEEDRLIGVCAVGYGVSHLVSVAALLVESGFRKNMQLPIIFSHPTLDEALKSAMVEPLESILS